MASFKEEYSKYLADKILVAVDDLSENERILIDSSYELFMDKMGEISVLNDEIKRISLELRNLRAMLDDRDYEGDE